MRADDTNVAMWTLVIAELPYLYTSCSIHHLQDVASVIIDVFTAQSDQNVETNKYTIPLMILLCSVC